MDSWTYQFSTIYTITALSFIGFYLLYYYKNAFDYWRRKGLRGPKPLPVFGNVLSLLLQKPAITQLKWTREYGKIYGIYRGAKPVLVINDPDTINQICIKDFDLLQNHCGRGGSNELMDAFVANQRDNHWKRVRALLSPTFTSGKIRRMFKMLDSCADDLVQCFHEQLIDGHVVDTRGLYSLYTMDSIMTCCYGIKLERAGSKDIKSASRKDEFVRTAMKLFNFSILRFTLSMVMPSWILKLFRFELIPMEPIEPIIKQVSKLIDTRRNSTKRLDDYLQILVEAKLNEKMELDEMDNVENHHAGLNRESILRDQGKMVEAIKDGSKVTLTDTEILSSALFMMLVGLETTGSLLACCSYSLAFHDEVQERLYEELKKIAKINEDNQYTFEYEALTSCAYLDSVLSESLRVSPPAPETDRVTNDDCYIEQHNLHIPKGTDILINIFSIQNDPDYWVEPERFNPSRFMPENRDGIRAGTYIPFGRGPRHCLAMRFALTEAKIALAKVVMNFKLSPAPNTCYPSDTPSTIMSLTPKESKIRIVSRRSIES